MDQETPRPGTLRATLLGALLILLAAAAGCSGPGEPGAGAPGPHEGTSHPSVGTKAPNFAAEDPSGSWLPLVNLKGKPVAVLFFRPGAPFTSELVTEMSRLRDDPAFAPTIFIGVARDSMDRIKQFRDLQKPSMAILRDPGTIGPSFGIGDLPTIVLIDADGIIRFRLDGYVGALLRPRWRATVEALRGLPRGTQGAGKPIEVAYTENPRAPIFSAKDLDGRKVDLAALKGRVVVLTFFDQECPHCKRDLPLLVPVLKEFRARGVVAIGVSSRDVGGGMRRFLKEHGIDYSVILDTDRAIFSKYESTRTPDTFIIDGDGFIRFHEQGDRPDRADLTRLQLRLAIGRETPAALAATLPPERYSGDGTCRACHAREYGDWLLTPHSIAWESLQSGDKWRDQECVHCHVTGAGRPGGYAGPETTAQMVNVQCEVCHGPGGGHPGAARVDPAAMSNVCQTCHNGKFVLNFKVDEALALVAHRDHPDLEKLFHYSDLQRQRLEEMNQRRLEKFRSGVAYVGAEACRDCHRAEFEQWGRTPHAAAYARILQLGRGADRSCSPCHTTGMGHKGGFGDDKASGGAMTSVQCEVCHGPGADHVKAPPALKKQTIYGITDQCSFCIIQGVCATCHDRANDPKFDIEKALPLIKHLPADGAAGRSAARQPPRPRSR
ncbi:MAG TPA: redoxin domain-containing protein [Candidatus Polarisedimenticolia bacterium]|nr:redoxin domain-containing protein [Candidatus Polarisedimenticolia bacterium]